MIFLGSIIVFSLGFFAGSYLRGSAYENQDWQILKWDGDVFGYRPLKLGKYIKQGDNIMMALKLNSDNIPDPGFLYTEDQRMALNESEEKLVRDCINAFKRTILQIQNQITQLENQLYKSDQIDLFDTKLDIPIKKGQIMPKKKNFKWEVRKTESGKWGIFLMQEFCKTDEPVCYGVSINKNSAQSAVDRMNDPNYWHEDE